MKAQVTLEQLLIPPQLLMNITQNIVFISQNMHFIYIQTRRKFHQITHKSNQIPGCSYSDESLHNSGPTFRLFKQRDKEVTVLEDEKEAEINCVWSAVGNIGACTIERAA